MYTEDLLIHYSCNGEAVESVREGTPDLDAVATLALLIKSVYTVDGGALVVATEEEEVLREFDLESEEEADGFKGLATAINVVTEEEVVALWGKATIFEETEKIIILPMSVTANLNRGLKLKKSRLAHKNIATAKHK